MLNPQELPVSDGDEPSTFQTALMKNLEKAAEKKKTNTVRPYKISVEPVLVAVYFALYIAVCGALGKNTDDGHAAEALVQPYTADYLMWKNILQSIVPAVLSLFLGPWTDLHGRKPVLVSAVSGVTLTFAIYLILCFIPDLHPAFILLGVLPFSLMGGIVNMIAACYCYITDVTEPTSRSFRLGLLEGSLYTGMLIGLLTSSYIYDGAAAYGYGFEVIFGTSAASCLLVLIYMVIYVEESVDVTEPPRGLKGLVNISLPLEMAKTCVRSRPENRRAILFLCYMASAASQLVLDGESQVEYLFSRLRFGWDLEDFTLFSSFSMLIAIISTVGATWLLPKYLKVPDAYLAVMSFGTDIGQGVMYALATPAQWYFMYIGAAVASLRGVVGPAVTSILSTTVPPQDVGKVFALSSSLEAVMPIAASPIYVNVYNATLDSVPGTYYLLSAALYLVAAIFMGIIAAIQRRYTRRPAN